MTDTPAFVVLDVSSLVLMTRAGVDRCLDTVLATGDADTCLHPAGAVLGSVYAALERVLVAHVACDPFVFERPGTRAVLERLAARQVPLIGVTPFPLPVASVVARRFDWPSTLALTDEAATDSPVWAVAERAVRSRGWDPARGAFVADDPRELDAAREVGFGRAVSVTNRTMRHVLFALLPSERSPLPGSATARSRSSETSRP